MDKKIIELVERADRNILLVEKSLSLLAKKVILLQKKSDRSYSLIMKQERASFIQRGAFFFACGGFTMFAVLLIYSFFA